MTDAPPFDIPERPERRYTPGGGVEYDGATVFRLTPVPGRSTDDLDALLREALSADRYVLGDFYDLPAPVYLVRDHEVGTSFRVVVRTGRVEFHVQPHTDAAGLEALYEHLDALADGGWDVSRRA